eukprot:GHUV01011930.1.p1 GENE.GHUV01011930.1~~GHUV01011930.1.p1  ORF type:complete len:139 (+),score=31.73 GHUV01011930.1:1518-1934(+)
MVSLWSEQLSHLQHEGIINGFVLITPQGPSEIITGPFVEECEQGISPALQQLVKPFYSVGPAPTTYDIWGTKLFVINQTDSYLVAISKQRRSGILAINLPSGVLLAAFDKAVQPTVALTAVQQACATAFAGASPSSCR